LLQNTKTGKIYQLSIQYNKKTYHGPSVHKI
jgi:hypothetical protein